MRTEQLLDRYDVYLGLGSNLGDRRANITAAIAHLKQHVAVERISSIYETEPAYVLDQPRFYNAVLQGQTHLAPRALLDFVKRIEQDLGRTAALRYGPRLIDIDILACGAVQVDNPDLTIPHPLIPERAFVLVPWAEIAPNLVLPSQQRSIAELAVQVEGAGNIVRVLTEHSR